MKAILTVVLLLAVSFKSYCPDFELDWFNKGLQVERDIAAMEVEYAEKQAKHLKILKIMAVIRHIESRGNYHLNGGTGEYGAYQFMPKTWSKKCKKYAGKYLKPTKENQDFIAYCSIRDHVDAGYSVSQIGSIWNSGYPNCTKVGVTKTGIPFDVPAYRRNFVSLYRNIKV